MSLASLSLLRCLGDAIDALALGDTAKAYAFLAMSLARANGTNPRATRHILRAMNYCRAATNLQPEGLQ